MGKSNAAVGIDELEKMRADRQRVKCTDWKRDESLGGHESFGLNGHTGESALQYTQRTGSVTVSPATDHLQMPPDTLWICRIGILKLVSAIRTW